MGLVPMSSLSEAQTEPCDASRLLMTRDNFKVSSNPRYVRNPGTITVAMPLTNVS